MAKLNNLEKISQKCAEGIYNSIMDTFKRTYQQYKKIDLYSVDYDEFFVDPKSHKYYWQPLAYFKLEDPNNKTTSAKYMVKVWLDPLEGKSIDKIMAYSNVDELTKAFSAIIPAINDLLLTMLEDSYIDTESVTLLYLGKKAVKVQDKGTYDNPDYKFSRYYAINEDAFCRYSVVMSRPSVSITLQYARVRLNDFDGFSLFKEKDLDIFIAPETASSPMPNQSDITALVEMYGRKGDFYGDSLRKSLSAFPSQVTWKSKEKKEGSADEN